MLSMVTWSIWSVDPIFLKYFPIAFYYFYKLFVSLIARVSLFSFLRIFFTWNTVFCPLWNHNFLFFFLFFFFHFESYILCIQKKSSLFHYKLISCHYLDLHFVVLSFLLKACIDSWVLVKGILFFSNPLWRNAESHSMHFFWRNLFGLFLLWWTMEFSNAL